MSLHDAAQMIRKPKSDLIDVLRFLETVSPRYSKKLDALIGKLEYLQNQMLNERKTP